MQIYLKNIFSICLFAIMSWGQIYFFEQVCKNVFIFHIHLGLHPFHLTRYSVFPFLNLEMENGLKNHYGCNGDIDHNDDEEVMMIMNMILMIIIMTMIKKMKHHFCDYDYDHDDEDDVPLLGNGLGGEDLVAQLVLLAPLHPGGDCLFVCGDVCCL